VGCPQAASHFVGAGWAWGVNLAYLLEVAWEQDTSWAELGRWVFLPVWLAAQQQFVDTFAPWGLGLFYGVAGSGVLGLSLCFNGVLLLTQVAVQ
jgi:hypothetical protein